MISLRSGLCILASTGVSLQKVVPLGIHTNVNTYAAVSYWSCFVFFCRRFWRFFIICFISPSCVVRYLHLRFVGLFVYFVVRVVSIPYVSCSGYGLVPVLSVSCSISFLARSIQISFFVLWLSILLKFIWYGHHHPRRVLVAPYRPPFVLIRPYSDTGHAASDCSVGKTVPCYPPPCKSAPTTRSHQVSPSNHPAFSVPFPTLFLESGPRLHPHHNEGVAPDVLTFEFLDPFAIKLTLLVVRYLQFSFSCHPLTRCRLLSSLQFCGENFKFR